MVGCVGGGPGGIGSLHGLIDEFAEAVGADLLTIGKRVDDIGSESFSWWDFKVWVAFRPPESILMTKVHGPYYPLELRIQGMLVDLLRAANWQRGGGKGQRPKPKWPWASGETSESFGTAAPFEQVRDYLMLRNGRVPGK